MRGVSYARGKGNTDAVVTRFAILIVRRRHERTGGNEVNYLRAGITYSIELRLRHRTIRV